MKKSEPRVPRKMAYWKDRLLNIFLKVNTFDIRFEIMFLKILKKKIEITFWSNFC